MLCSGTKPWIAGSWSFPAEIAMAGWWRHRDYARRSGRYIRSPSEDAARNSPAPKPHLLAGIRRGREPMGAQTLRVQLAGECLDEAVVGRPARP